MQSADESREVKRRVTRVRVSCLLRRARALARPVFPYSMSNACKWDICTPPPEGSWPFSAPMALPGRPRAAVEHSQTVLWLCVDDWSFWVQVLLSICQAWQHLFQRLCSFQIVSFFPFMPSEKCSSWLSLLYSPSWKALSGTPEEIERSGKPLTPLWREIYPVGFSGTYCTVNSVNHQTQKCSGIHNVGKSVHKVGLSHSLIKTSKGRFSIHSLCK